MDQPTFADLEYEGKKRKTRREMFLDRMDGLIPWQNLQARIRLLPHGWKGETALSAGGHAAGPLRAALLQSQ